MTHDIVKEIVSELLKSTQNADIGHHINQLLDELYAQNTGLLEDGKLPSPPVMPDLAETIEAQTRALQAVTADDAQTHHMEMAAMLRESLALFAVGPNERALKAFLQAVDGQVKSAQSKPFPIPDYTVSIQVCIDTLSKLEGLDDPTSVQASATRCLQEAIGVFAHGPNQEPIETLLDQFTGRMAWANTQLAMRADATEALQIPLDTLSNLDERDNPLEIMARVTHTLCQALSIVAKSPNEALVQTFLNKVDVIVKQATTLTPLLPDYTSCLQPHLEQLEALVHETDPDVLSRAGATLVGKVLSTFAQGPNEAAMQAVIDAIERIEKQKEMSRLWTPDKAALQPHIDALMALEELDDPEALTAAAAMALYDALAAMANDPNAGPLQSLLDTFDQVTGAQ